ncbi:MAG: hypothetical protein Q7O66_10050, partial [Dehalococcoidia bacterium]|nr:hypothetical protein [Dehalococcoidia bacterium]
MFWCGVLIGVISPLFTVLVVAAARIGAGHLSPLERFAALGLPGIAWLAFLASFVLALVLYRRGGSDRSLFLLPFLGVMIYPFVWLYVSRSTFWSEWPNNALDLADG